MTETPIVSLPRIAFLGFGEFAYELARSIREAGGPEVWVFARQRADPVAAEALERRLRDVGAQAAMSLEDALARADILVAAVPATAAGEIEEQVLNAPRPGLLYVDPAPRHPSEKLASADRFSAASLDYVDLAVLGSVSTAGSRVPMLAAGPGARRWSQHADALGMQVTFVKGDAGTATLVKLLRSVFLKGRDALILEMLLTARRYGLERVVVDSIGGPGERVSFPDLADRVMSSLALYAERRADELRASARVVNEAQIEPLVTDAAAERLRRLAAHPLRDHFHQERPRDLEEVLEAIDQLSGTERETPG